MQDNDLDFEELPEVAEVPAKHVAEPDDPNSLRAVLASALRDVDEIGGPDRARLSTVVGRKMYDAMMSKTSTRNAMDAWLSASPRTKSSATRMLALAVAREAERPDLVDRIAREIDEDVFGDRPDAVKPTPAKSQERTKVRAQQKSGQRVADPDLVELAKRDDITAYRQARLNPRGGQRTHRHGVG